MNVFRPFVLDQLDPRGCGATDALTLLLAMVTLKGLQRLDALYFEERRVIPAELSIESPDERRSRLQVGRYGEMVPGVPAVL